jgi:uncharacterized protein YicC (UPF0701 family)
MAVYSMTGYASASTGDGVLPRLDAAANDTGDAAAAPNAGTVTVEARSVNGRFLDVSFRLPDELRALEPALRDLMGAGFKRGKIEMRVSTTREAESTLPQVSPDQLNRLAHLQSSVQAFMPQARALSVNEALNLCKGGATNTKLDEPTLAAAKRCIKGLQEARAREGARLATMLLDRVANLRALAAQAGPLLPAVVARQQARFLERWNEALRVAKGSAENSAKETAKELANVPEQASHERALSEAASFAIRIDVAEELTRLASHLDEIERLLGAGGELGKRLEFLIQELQREANTLGSKSAAIELTTIAVDMKVAIEQMREQVQNIE